MPVTPPEDPVLRLLRDQLAELQRTTEEQQADLQRLLAEAEAREAKIDWLREDLTGAQKLAACRMEELELLRRAEAVLAARIEALLASTSWRVTVPLRWLRRLRG